MAAVNGLCPKEAIVFILFGGDIFMIFVKFYCENLLFYIDILYTMAPRFGGVLAID